ncbi:MAG: hypothetical protein HYU53_05325 [Acidobacteria bacterium]|nr:hypothetical protein [Acidobacteriota bacterium]
MADESLERRIDQLAAEMRQGFDQENARFGQVDARFEAVDRRFDEMTETLKSHMSMVGARLEMRFQQVLDGHFALRDRVDAHERRHDATDRRLDAIDGRVTALEHRRKH